MSIGVFAIGAVLGSQALLEQNTSIEYIASNPANAIIYAKDIPQTLVDVIAGMDDVKIAESRRRITLRLSIRPNEWRSLMLSSFPNNKPGDIGEILSKEGMWPPLDKGLVLEQSALTSLGATVGDLVQVETLDRTQRVLPIVGTVHDIAYRGPLFSGNRLAGYVTEETLAWLGEPSNFVELHLVVAENQDDSSYITSVTTDVIHQLERAGQTNLNSRVPTPGEYSTKSLVDSMLAVLGVIGLVTAILGSVLVINSFNALLLEQVREIGIMKSIGAQTHQLIFMYVVLALLYGIATLIPSLPMAIIFSNILSSYVAGLMNFEPNQFSVPVSAFIIPALISVMMPVVVTLLPIWQGSRLTVQQALTKFGAVGGSSQNNKQAAPMRSSLVKLPEWMAPSRPFRLTLRNSFRRYGRISMTLATLAIGGAMMISVLSLQKSLGSTLEDLQRYFLEDVQVLFDRPYRTSKIDQQIKVIPGIASVEHWSRASARIVYLDNSESNTIILNALPAGSKLVQPTITEGTWLTQEDSNSLVIGSDVARQEDGIRVGQTIRMTIDGRESEWLVSGIALAVGNNPTPSVYISKSAFNRVTKQINQSNVLKVVAENLELMSQSSIAQLIEISFGRSNIHITNIQTQSQLRNTIQSQFDILIGFLLIMCVMVSVVGGIGLTGTLSMNVMERQREIGVMRSIGASNLSIQSIVVGEGIIISLVGWILAVVIAFPLNQILNRQVGVHLLNAPILSKFSWNGVVLWLLCSITLAIVASLLPARRASRLTIREAIAYE